MDLPSILKPDLNVTGFSGNPVVLFFKCQHLNDFSASTSAELHLELEKFDREIGANIFIILTLKNFAFGSSAAQNLLLSVVVKVVISQNPAIIEMRACTCVCFAKISTTIELLSFLFLKHQLDCTLGQDLIFLCSFFNLDENVPKKSTISNNSSPQNCVF